MITDDLDVWLAPHGLFVMGTLSPRAMELDNEIGTLVLIGADPGMWSAFQAAPEANQAQPNPLDQWSKRIIGGLASDHGASCLFPSDGPPYAPFIDWALKSGRFWQSPVGMMVHDRAGLMISIRGALAFNDDLSLPKVQAQRPCNACTAPCLQACPVGALGAVQGYDVPACKAHLSSPQGVNCMSGGCLARRICPVSKEFGRDPEQSAFHMRAFMPS